jgi:hypothetical protein
MYLSAERLALANQQVQETFEQSCVAWQAIPRWDTGDPGATRVRQDVMFASGNGPWVADSIGVTEKNERFNVSLGQSTAGAPDALLAAVVARTGNLAMKVDDDVIPKLFNSTKLRETDTGNPGLLNQLINARVAVEDAGYRAPSCLFVSTAGLQTLSQFESGYSLLEPLLVASNVNSLYRVPKTQLDETKRYMVMLGRRQRIAHGGAPGASAGEEPVDLAICVPPSLEVVGEVTNSNIELVVRIRYATRVKDARGAAIVNGLP